MDNDVAGPISARMDGRFADPPLEVRFPKYREYLRLKDIKETTRKVYIATKEEGESLVSEFNDTNNQIRWWEDKSNRLKKLPSHPERDSRIAYADRAIAGGEAELRTIWSQMETQKVKSAEALDAFFKAQSMLEEFVLSLCK